MHDLLSVAAAPHMGGYLCPVLPIQTDALSYPLLLFFCEWPLALCQLISSLDLQQAGLGCSACAKYLSHVFPLQAQVMRLTVQDRSQMCFIKQPGSKAQVHVMGDGWTPSLHALTCS